MDISMSHEYARMKDLNRRQTAAWTAFFWLFCTVTFVSWGGYCMYQSMGVKGILCGSLLLIVAVVTSFLMICSTLDAMDL